MPAELPAPCCAGVPRKPSWNGFASRSCCVSVPALVQHGSLKSRLTAAFCSVALLHSAHGEVVPVERVGPAVLAADGDRDDAGGLQLRDVGVEELVHRGRRVADAGLGEERLAVPEADDVRGCTGTPYCLPLYCQPGDRAAERRDPGLDVLGDVHDLAGLHLGRERAAAPLLEDVGRAARLQRERDLGVLQLLVLDRDGPSPSTVGMELVEVVRRPSASRPCCGPTVALCHHVSVMPAGSLPPGRNCCRAPPRAADGAQRRDDPHEQRQGLPSSDHQIAPPRPIRLSGRRGASLTEYATFVNRYRYRFRHRCIFPAHGDERAGDDRRRRGARRRLGRDGLEGDQRPLRRRRGHARRACAP